MQRPLQPFPRIRALALCVMASLLPAAAAKAQPQADAPEEPEAAPAAVLIVLTNHAQLGDTGVPTGFFLSEAAHPWHVFEAAGMPVTLASPVGGLAPIDPKSMQGTDPINDAFVERFVTDACVPDTLALVDVDPAAFDVVFFAGGHGTMWDFPDHPQVNRVGDAVYAQGGVIAAVCHGPAALVGLTKPDGTPLVQGQPANGFTNEEEVAVELMDVVPFALETVLRDLGAEWSESANFQPHVAVGERLVTGQNPASATATAEAVVALLRD